MASMIELIQELWQLKREIVSDDYDRALDALGPRSTDDDPRDIQRVRRCGPGRYRRSGLARRPIWKHWMVNA